MKNFHYLLLLFTLFQFINCENKDSKKPIINDSSFIDIEQSISIDSANSEEIYPEESLEKYPELIIYSINSYEKNENQSSGFIPLTDSYPWSENKDSIAISSDYLGNKEFANHHVLNEKYRTRFLKALKIQETDSVFIYNYRIDSLYTFLVNELPLMAHITVYGAEPPISQYDYLIGLDLQNVLALNDMGNYYDAFVYVGSENPFNNGKLQPIIWEKIDPGIFPKEVKSSSYSNLKINQLYKFQMKNMDYYLLNKTHLIIQDSKTKKVISEYVFSENESASFAPLSFAHQKKESLPEQWTGNLFKNKPSVFFGFIYESFGCTSINFIEKPENNIYIRCDNRH